jgi:hypothetical protein
MRFQDRRFQPLTHSSGYVFYADDGTYGTRWPSRSDSIQLVLYFA